MFSQGASKMVEVIATESFVEWRQQLEIIQLIEVTRVVDMLEIQGFRLGFPYSIQRDSR